MPSRYFPPASYATPEGLVFVGGRLTTARLLDGYRNGIFPWPTHGDAPMLWWSPDPRAVLPLDGLYVSSRLERRLRNHALTVSFDEAFDSVIRSCGTGPGRELGTWLTPEMIDAYNELHTLGHAHSVEVWQGGELVGGVYGVAIGAFFSAESMFHRTRDGSKMALFHLVVQLRRRRFELLDVQQWTPHTGRMGVVEISRREYLKRLKLAVDLPRSFLG